MGSHLNGQRPVCLAAVIACASLLLSACGGNSDSAEGGNQPTELITPKGWELVWSDDFDGNALDEGKWNIQTGDGTAEGIPGWGNNELQTYQADNIAVAGGELIITARSGSVGSHNYTSARINTSGKFDFLYGRVEASIQTPPGKGLWSAFWMLPTDSPYGGWAASGEIDIMEVFSRDPAPYTQAVAHYGMAWPLNVVSYKQYTNYDPADGFHTYALEWDQNELRWFVDGTHYHTIGKDTYWSYYKDEDSNAHMEGGDSAPFDSKFHMLLNLAVGGNLPGDPEPSALPGEMRVDYVRVYKCNFNEATGVGCDGEIDYTDPAVVPPAADSVYTTTYDLYIDQPGPVTFPDVEENLPLSIGVWDNNGALGVLEMPDSAERGTVIDMMTTGGGNMSLFATDTSRQSFFGMGDAADSGDYAGEIQFDLYIDSAGTDLTSAIQVKLDSGFPDLGFVELAIADLPQDEWTRVTVQISDIVHNPGNFGGGPVDMSRVLSLFVLEPTGRAHLRVDNIRLVCGHPEDMGCGMTPPAPPQPTVAEPFDVFVDSVNPVWDVGIAAADSGSGWANYSDGANAANKVQWRQSTSSDTARGQILEVNFAGGDTQGVWFIQSSAGINLGAYTDGYVSFDIRVPDYGENSEGMTMKIDCVFPCTSGDQAIGKVGDGDWETVRIPVSQLVAGGLNLANVNTGIVVFPTTSSQSVPLTFEIANVRWLPGEATLPPDLPGLPGSGASGAIVLFRDGLDPNWALWDCCGGASFAVVADADSSHDMVAEFTFNRSETVSGLMAASAIDAAAIASGGGHLMFDFKASAPPPEGSMWRLKLESAEAATAGEVLLTDHGNPAPNDGWQSYSFPIGEGVLAGVDFSALTLVMVFPDWASQAGAVYRINNVRLVPAEPEIIVETIPLFDDAVSAGWGFFCGVDGLECAVVADRDGSRGMVAEVTFNRSQIVPGFEANPPADASAHEDAKGHLKFDFKMVAPPPEGSTWLLKIESTNSANFAEVSLTDYGNPMPNDTWQSYTFPVSEAPISRVDFSRLRLVLVFPTWASQTGAVYRIDNVRIESGE